MNIIDNVNNVDYNNINHTSKLKRYKSAYLLFFLDKKEEIKQQMLLDGQVYSYSLLLKQIGHAWKHLNDSEKIKYINREKEEKKLFELNKGSAEFKYKTCHKIKKPKRFRTAFMFYLQENKQYLNKENIIEQLKQIGSNWKTLTEEEKSIYKRKELEDKERYYKEYEEYTKYNIRKKVNKPGKKENNKRK